MSTASALPAVPLTHRQVLIVFSGLMLGMLLAALDQTIVATALPTIVGDLGGLDKLSWVVTAYLLTSTASLPLYGKISDLLGRKIVFQFAIVVFLTGSALCGLSQNMGELIAFRAVQGLGGGGLMVIAQAIIGDIVSPRERGRYQGYTGGVFALASVAGPLLGGLLTDQVSWRWIFYINLPIGILALFVTSGVLRLPFRRVQHRIDYLGSALIVGAVSCVLLVTVWGGSQYAWTSRQIVGLALAALVLLLVFIWQERRADEPMLPLRLFRVQIFSVTSLVGVIIGMVMFGCIIFLPLYFQIVNGASATRSGLLLIPLMLGLVVASVGSGRLITRTGRYRVFPIAGTAVLAGGIALLSRLSSDTPRVILYADMAVTGLGVGMVMQVLVLAVQNAVAHSDLGTATAAANFFRSMGGAFGTALFGTLLNKRLEHYLPRFVAPERLAVLHGAGNLLSRSPGQLKQLPPDIHRGLVEAFVHGFDDVFLWALPLAVLAFVITWFLRELPLREHAHIGAGDGGTAAPEPVASGMALH